LKVWIVFSLYPVDGGYLPDDRQIEDVCDSYEKAEEICERYKKEREKEEDYGSGPEYDIQEYDVE
jgi:hypothetical protein